ncbi:MAG: ISAs1 family transposase [Planctomycetaceae bacterium]
MQSACAGSLLAKLAQVPDPRGRKGRRHPLSAMLTAVVCGLLCGNRSYTALAEWLHSLPVDVWHWMGYTRRPPKRDCFRDLLMKLDPTVLEQALTEWIAAQLGLELDEHQLRAVSLDGKTLCGTLRPHSRAVHLLSLVDHANGCVLSQMRVHELTNEHKAALELLKTLTLKGRIVTADAIFCQRDLCQQFLDAGGHYLIAVKENQPQLLRDITLEMAAPVAAFSPLRPASANLGA